VSCEESEESVTGRRVCAVAERHGALLEPGVNTLALAPGKFFFKTMSDADLRVVSGAAVAHRGGGKNLPPLISDPTPDPPPTFPGGRGDDPLGSLPTLTVS
jgi:hypothetical protein